MISNAVPERLPDGECDWAATLSDGEAGSRSRVGRPMIGEAAAGTGFNVRACVRLGAAVCLFKRRSRGVVAARVDDRVRTTSCVADLDACVACFAERCVGVACGVGDVTDGAGSGGGSASAGRVTAGGGSDGGGCGSSARAVEARSANRPTASVVPIQSGRTCRTLARVLFGGVIMEDPSADVSHDYARASRQRRQLAIWLGFRAGCAPSTFQQLLAPLWKSVFSPARAVGDA